MLFHDTALPGVLAIVPEPKTDKRGFFARTFCIDELKEQGIHFNVAQCNVTSTLKKGTIRGLHFQLPPTTEQKIVRSIKGAVCYVLADLRPDSPTYLQNHQFELDADRGNMLYVPPGFASGAQTLSDDSQLFYTMSERYSPGRESGMRYDDLALNIRWPLPVTVVSEKDLSWPPFAVDVTETIER